MSMRDTNEMQLYQDEQERIQGIQLCATSSLPDTRKRSSHEFNQQGI